MWRLLSIFLILPGISGAGELVTPNSSNPYPALPGVDYYCVGAGGERYELGEVACLITNSCSQPWFAKCDVTNHVPMWRKTMDGCPGASLLDRLKRLDPGFDALGIHTKIAPAKSQAS